MPVLVLVELPLPGFGVAAGVPACRVRRAVLDSTGTEACGYAKRYPRPTENSEEPPTFSAIGKTQIKNSRQNHALRGRCFHSTLRTFVTTATQSPSSSAIPTKPLSLGVIFLTLYIDLIGFSIIFPLGPDLITHYLQTDGQSGLLGWLLDQSNALAHVFGRDNAFAAVLFGGVLTSFFSILQFIFAPFWGAISDK